MADLKAVTDAYKGERANSAEDRMVADMQDVIVILESLYTDALVEASENFQAAGAQKNTTREGGVKYSQRYLAAETNTEILEMITRVIDGDFSSNSKVHLGVVPDDVANTISGITGIDVQGFDMAIEARMVEHILKGHGKTGDADRSMQDPNHLARIQYVLFQADDIRDAGRTSAYTHFKNGKSRPAPTVLYEKSIGEKSYYVVQAVPDTKAKTLYVVSAFIGPEGYKKEASQLINAQGPDATAITDSVVASKSSIRNPAADVKEKFSLRDSEDRELTKEQQEYFKNSKVRDNQGHLLVMHHGTKSEDFTVFDRNKGKRTGYANFGRGNYFTVFEDGAKNYGNRTISAYLKIENPLISSVHRGAFETDASKALEISTDEISRQTVSALLKEKGYDGVILYGMGEDEGKIVICVTYDSNQIKEVSNLAPTDDPDIRYSLRDDDYMEAVNSGDMVAAQKMVEASENFQTAGAQKNTTQEDGVKYSLRAFEKDGRRFVEIDQDQDRFDGHPDDEYPGIAKEIIKEKFENKVIGIDHKMFVNGAGRSEYAYPSKPITDASIYEAKMRASPELDNLLDAGTNFRNESDGKDGHVHPDAVGGFDYFDTLFKIGSRYFEGRINIKNIKRGKLFTDVTQIKDVTQAIMSSYGNNPKSQFLRTSSMNSIRNPEADVKEKFSIRDSEGHELSKEQQEYFKDSKARDAQGRLLVLYHQTDGDFTVFETRHPGAGSRDSDTPFGIFMKRASGDIGLSGKKQMALYANITNPLRAENRENLISQLKDISADYANISDKHKRLDREYHDKFEQAKNAWRDYIAQWRASNPDAKRSALYDDPKFNALFEAEDAVIEEWTAEADRLSTQAKEGITENLRKAGCDGIFGK